MYLVWHKISVVAAKVSRNRVLAVDPQWVFVDVVEVVILGVPPILGHLKKINTNYLLG